MTWLQAEQRLLGPACVVSPERKPAGDSDCFCMLFGFSLPLWLYSDWLFSFCQFHLLAELRRSRQQSRSSVVRADPTLLAEIPAVNHFLFLIIMSGDEEQGRASVNTRTKHTTRFLGRAKCWWEPKGQRRCDECWCVFGTETILIVATEAWRRSGWSKMYLSS